MGKIVFHNVNTKVTVRQYLMNHQFNLYENKYWCFFAETAGGLRTYKYSGTKTSNDNGKSTVEEIQDSKLKLTYQMYIGTQVNIYKNIGIKSKIGWSNLPVQLGLTYQL